MVHGLTGKGVALPIEDQAEIERRFQTLGDELKPVDEKERALVHRAAFLMVRVDRCQKFETAGLTEAMRTAIADHDEAIMADVEAAAADLPERPAASVRKLCRTYEGIDWLLKEWAYITRDIPSGYWANAHVLRAELLLGRRNDAVGYSTVNTLSGAMMGDFRLMDPVGFKAPTEPEAIEARKDAARAELVKLIEAELDRLRKVRASIDAEAVARSRAEAPLRRLFSPSNGALLFRRYETAASRELLKILAMFPTPERAESTSSDGADEVCAELASPGNSGDHEAEADPSPTPPTPETGPESPPSDEAEVSAPRASDGLETRPVLSPEGAPECPNPALAAVAGRDRGTNPSLTGAS